jgi:hypothetical protein
MGRLALCELQLKRAHTARAASDASRSGMRTSYGRLSSRWVSDTRGAWVQGKTLPLGARRPSGAPWAVFTA